MNERQLFKVKNLRKHPSKNNIKKRSCVTQYLVGFNILVLPKTFPEKPNPDVTQIVFKELLLQLQWTCNNQDGLPQLVETRTLRLSTLSSITHTLSSEFQWQLVRPVSEADVSMAAHAKVLKGFKQLINFGGNKLQHPSADLEAI